MKRPKRALGETPAFIHRRYLQRHRKHIVEITDSILPPPHLIYHGANRWELTEEYLYTPADSALPAITIPSGFIFDLASVPRKFWWLIAPFDLSIVAPLIHDFLYGSGGHLTPFNSPIHLQGHYTSHPADRPTYTRETSDRLFLRIMRQERVSAWRRALAYRTVRLFGASSWKA